MAFIKTPFLKLKKDDVFAFILSKQNRPTLYMVHSVDSKGFINYFAISTGKMYRTSIPQPKKIVFKRTLSR